MMIARLGLLTAVLFSTCLTMSHVNGQQADFRIETDVFAEDQKEPVYQTVTFFQAGVAYDFPRDGGYVSMVAPKSNRLVLLDSKRQVRTQVDLAELTRLLDNAKTGAPGLLATIIAEADQVDVSDAAVSVGASILHYRATFQKPPSASMAAEYAAFADALARLNAGRQPAALPYARLKLNAVLADKAVLPKEITKTLSLGAKPQVQRSILHATWRLSSEHQRRINEVQSNLVSFEEVSQQEFFTPDLAAAATGAKR